MNRIEKNLGWAKKNRRVVGGTKKRRASDDQSGRKKTSQENAGEKWIETLRVEPTFSGGQSESRVILSDSQEDRVRSAYKMLRTRTLRRMRQNNWHVIGVTSPLQGDGKSLTSVNLALSLARDVTLSVILLELDLRRPTISKQFGIDPAKGLSDYLNGTAKLDKVLIRPEGTERIAILPSTEVYEDSSEVLSSPKMVALMDKLRGSDPGRVIICDLPPYLATDDVLAFAPLADSFLVVVSEGWTSRDVLEKGLDILQELPLLGVVLNRSEEGTTGYYY